MFFTRLNKAIFTYLCCILFDPWV